MRLPQERTNKTAPYVEVGEAAIKAQVIRICRCIGVGEGRGRLPVVDGFGECVVHVELQSMLEAVLSLHYECMVIGVDSAGDRRQLSVVGVDATGVERQCEGLAIQAR